MSPRPEGEMAGMFQPNETACLQELANEAVRRDWLTARTALKFLAAEVIGGPCKRFQVVNRADGRPVLMVDSKTADQHISLAHTGGWGGAAMGTGPVGIDLEFEDESNSRLRQYIGEEEEFSRLKAALGRAEYRSVETILFCIKESALKCLGLGLTIPCGQIRLIEAWSCDKNLGLAGFRAKAVDSGLALSGVVLGRGDLIVGLAWTKAVP